MGIVSKWNNKQRRSFEFFTLSLIHQQNIESLRVRDGETSWKCVTNTQFWFLIWLAPSTGTNSRLPACVHKPWCCCFYSHPLTFPIQTHNSSNSPPPPALSLSPQSMSQTTHRTLSREKEENATEHRFYTFPSSIIRAQDVTIIQTQRERVRLFCTWELKWVSDGKTIKGWTRMWMSSLIVLISKSSSSLSSSVQNHFHIYDDIICEL
jgi:hypothetical protein